MGVLAKNTFLYYDFKRNEKGQLTFFSFETPHILDPTEGTAHAAAPTSQTAAPATAAATQTAAAPEEADAADADSHSQTTDRQSESSTTTQAAQTGHHAGRRRGHRRWDSLASHVGNRG